MLDFVLYIDAFSAKCTEAFRTWVGRTPEHNTTAESEHCVSLNRGQQHMGRVKQVGRNHNFISSYTLPTAWNSQGGGVEIKG